MYALLLAVTVTITFIATVVFASGHELKALVALTVWTLLILWIGRRR